MSEKPNIIYIFSDQHRGDTLGCVGHPSVITPNLDKLAREGVIYTNCFTNSPLCMPARATMMTGRYVCEHGVWNNAIEARSNGPSHVRNIRDAGYHTALIGKTHLYTHGVRGKMKNRNEIIKLLEDWGFIDIHDLTGPWASAIHRSPYTDYLKGKGLLRTHKTYILRYLRKYWVSEAKPWEDPPSPLPTEDHLDSYTGRRAIEWIRNYNDHKPFYLQILFPGPHDPFDSPAEYRDMYNPENTPLGILEWPQEPTHRLNKSRLSSSGLKDMTTEQNQILRTFYYAKITLIDFFIGEIVKELAEKGLLDITWVIYNSDHGEMLGDHFMSHKLVFYEGAIHVPLIIRPPGGINGWSCQGLTDHLDITASLIEIADAQPLEGSEGRSLVSQVLSGPNSKGAQAGKKVIFSEVSGFSMVRSDKYKLVIESANRKPVEMYDLENDPNELNNLINNSLLNSVRQELIDNYLIKLLAKMDENKFKVFQENSIKSTLSGSPPKRAVE
ncbi:MAG: sulfatase [Candidatus Hodarchaeota archaeon]